MPKLKKEDPVPTSRPMNGTARIPRVVASNTVGAIDADAAAVWGSVDTLRVLLYGRSGSGKTTFWGSFPGPILALLCSGGNKPSELKSINTPEHRRKIKPVVIDSSERLQAELTNAHNFATVVLDHASGFADLVIKELLGLDKVPVGKSRKAAKGESWSLVSQQQYGQMAITCKEVFRDMLNLPGNVVFIAQERTFGGKDDGVDPELIRPTVGAALTPSLTGWLNPACDYVVQTFIRPRNVAAEGIKMDDGTVLDGGTKREGVEYCLRCEPHDVYQTKFRLPVTDKPLPTCIVLGNSVTGLSKPSGYERMMRVIRGEEVDDR